MQVQGTNINLYEIRKAGSSISTAIPVVCQTGVTLTIRPQFLDTKHKASGLGATRIYKSYEWQIDFSGAYYINPTNGEKSGADSLAAHLLNQRKIFMRFGSTDGTDTVYYQGRVVIGDLQFTGSTGQIGTFTVTLLGDGELAMTQGNATMYNLENYAACKVYKYTATGTVASFTATELVNKDVLGVSKIKTGEFVNRILTLKVIADGSGSVSSGFAGYATTLGLIKVNPSLVAGDVVLVYYE